MRRLPAVVVLVAACAVSGCTTVSPPPATAPAPVPQPTSARQAGPDRPQETVLVPAPGQEVLATVDPGPSTPPASRRPEPAASALRHRAHHQRSGSATPPVAPVPVPPLRGGTGVCDLGSAYGGWLPGSPAAQACRQAMGTQ